ncbi:Hint domain-containing protein [Roseovarius faecimaris]|uniref:Hint domain-containing protein n=1 Tax=Roseovarius faecimaris TaxID=2494550 RepID=A0A6I6IPH3_9RHOB|nr:Hint domain-containing protein [Roseovarius faecimaris]QGX98024.1 Hint domain-containing protein [Roseovarius faecimaris]
MSHSASKPAQSIRVYQALDFTVVNGANLGDAISFADELDLDDLYELRRNARTYRLSLVSDAAGHFTIHPETDLGRDGAQVYLDSCLTLMSTNGQTTELLMLVEVDGQNNVADVYVLPLAPITPRLGYALVGIDRGIARQKFAEVACVSFTRGTHITLASGAQKPVEDLTAGDKILTRDDGIQELRWIGQSTARAVGEFAPIRIRAGALHNENDLLVSPDHRLFIYQRSDKLGAGRSEVLVRARHLVNGGSVVREEGGFVDYFQLLFDEHQIIYAEGIAAETLLVDTRTREVLPQDISNALAPALPGHEARPYFDYEVNEALLDHLDAAELLRRASTR